MAALNGALALTDRPHGAVRIGEHLHLDVVAGGEVALAEHGRIAERRLGFAAGGFGLRRQLGQVVDHPHAAATATRRGLDQHRQLLGGDGVGIEFFEHRNTRGGHHLLRLDLGAHRGHRSDRRADPGQAGIEHRGSEFGVLGEEAVAGMDGVRPGGTGGRDQLRGVEVARRSRRVGDIGTRALESDRSVGLAHMRRRGVGIGVHGDGADAQPPAGVEHPPGDLTAVGDQNSSDHVGLTSGRRRNSTSP